MDGRAGRGRPCPTTLRGVLLTVLVGGLVGALMGGLAGCSTYGGGSSTSTADTSVARLDAGPGGIVALGGVLTGSGTPSTGASTGPSFGPSTASSGQSVTGGPSGGASQVGAPPSPVAKESRTLALGPSDNVQVTLPSQNIGCLFTATSVRCDIGDKSWQPPPKPADCTFDWGPALTVEAGGNSQFGCVSDTVRGSPDLFNYGTAISTGVIRCVSTEAGVDCRNSRSGHGFFLARTRYALF